MQPHCQLLIVAREHVSSRQAEVFAAADSAAMRRCCDTGVMLPYPCTTREPRVVAPGLLYETRPRDENYYPGASPSVPYNPAFIRPFTREVQTPDPTGRMGLSGWTPNTPVGSAGTGQREINGWLSFGITWTWGGPPPTARRRTAALTDQPAALAR